MKRLFILSILIMMMVYNECSKCTEYKEETKTSGDDSKTSGDDSKTAGDDSKTAGDDSKTTGGDSNTSTERRRLAVEEKTCSALATSDDKKKKCVVNKDKTGCEEVDKDSSSMIKIPLFLLISLLFI